jgi:hypothetical protein
MHNEPCLKVYAENGFAEEDGRWCFSGTCAEDPSWLTVRCDDAVSQVA